MKTFFCRQKLLFAFVLLFYFFQLNAQSSPEMVVVMLGNEKIADVNVDQNKYVSGIKDIIDLTEKEFKDIPTSQSLLLTVTTRKLGVPSFEIQSNPAIDKTREKVFLKKLSTLKPLNTKIVDFSFIVCLNSKKYESKSNFAIETEIQKRKTNFEKATLKEKYELTKQWSSEIVLPVLTAYQTMVDEKFAGVKGFGDKNRITDFNKKQDVKRLTSFNSDYWRATMEMEVGNQLIPITKIFMLSSQGEFDHADRYAEIISMYSRPESVSDEYLSEYKWRMGLFNDQLITEIEKGIAEHDEGSYEKAVKIYNDILKVYPNSAWTLYERYYSKNALAIGKGNASIDERKQWDAEKVAIYNHNPLYNMDVRASTGKEAYLLFRRYEISTLFKDKDSRMKDIFGYAEIAFDLEVYDFAAQLFWLKFTFDDKEQDSALHRYLYCLDKLGVKQLKSNFKGDFDKIFKDIDEEKKEVMTSNSMYKSFKK